MSLDERSGGLRTDHPVEGISLRVAIAGSGIAGTFLARLLQEKGIVPDLFDLPGHATSCRVRSCAWGAPASLGSYLSMAGLDWEQYLLERMDPMNFDDLVARTPLCTIDKPRLLADLGSGLSLHRRSLDPIEAATYDVIVDATGISRSILPPCRSDLVFPTVQHRVVVEPLGDDRLRAGVFGNRIPGLGYLWIFPLGRGEYHIGVGGIRVDAHEALLDEFYQENVHRFDFTRVCGCRGAIRVASPYYSTPLWSTRRREDGTLQRIIGVGESIGTVSPFTGEGILPSLECARLLSDSWPDERHYTSRVLSGFRWMQKERETLDHLLHKGRWAGPRVRDRWRFFMNARRSGIRLPLVQAFRRMGSLSRWVENP